MTTKTIAEMIAELVSAYEKPSGGSMTTKSIAQMIAELPQVGTKYDGWQLHLALAKVALLRAALENLVNEVEYTVNEVEYTDAYYVGDQLDDANKVLEVTRG